MCKCANVQMCKWSHFVAALVDEFINVQMGEMCECLVNVQMCECANGRILLLRWWMKLLMCKWGQKDSVVQRRQFAHLHILTFAH